MHDFPYALCNDQATPSVCSDEHMTQAEVLHGLQGLVDYPKQRPSLSCTSGSQQILTMLTVRLMSCLP